MSQRILIIEDDPRTATALCECFDGFDCKLKLLKYGKNSRFQSGVFCPDLIICSAELGGGAYGFVLCSQFRRDEHLRTIPLILLGSDSLRSQIEQHQKLATRADDYLIKPCVPSDLIASAAALVPLEDIGESTEDDFDDTWMEAKARDFVIPAAEQSVVRVGTGAPWKSKIAYSRAVKVGHMILVSGTAAIDENGAVFAPGEPYEQAKRSLEIIESTLAQLGAVMAQVVRTRIYVTNIDDWEKIGRAHAEYFEHGPPATSMVEVSRLIAPGLVVEIEAEAYADFSS